MKHRMRITTSLVLLFAFTTVAMAPVAGIAGTTGKRNTAIGLTAATVYAAAKGKGKTALVLGAGAAYAWKRTADSKRNARYNAKYYKGYRLGVEDPKTHRVYFKKDGRLRYYTVRR